MEHKRLSKEFKDYLDSLKEGHSTKEWVYVGKTDDAFGSPGGSWKGNDGYKFQDKKSKKAYLIRCIQDNPYIVMESFFSRRQIYNMDLTKKTIHETKNNQSFLLESYTMTAGKGRVKKKDVQDAFKAIGVNTNVIATINDNEPDWEGLLSSLIKWTDVREKVKQHLKTSGDKDATDMANNEETIKDEDSQVFIPLNQILFGPPGTGKTYHSINKALEVINDEEVRNLDWSNREQVKNLFNTKRDEGQIVFTTFHQSMSYEEFIEGIKPDLNDENEVVYDVEPGIFNVLAELARDNWMDAKKGGVKNLAFEDAFQKLIDEWFNDQDMKFPLKTEGYEYTIIGFTKRSIKFKKASGGTGHTLSISTLRDYYYKLKDVRYTGVGIYYPPILEKLKAYVAPDTEKKKTKKYVLIIDEINRGNVSQILGELITLIEDDKRLGNAEALEVTLPYSKEKFGVPPNLYIIGTMNTADRSVEALDTALRRRFSFVEMPPLYDLEGLKYEFAGATGTGILQKINMRIEKLLDRDHLIGHSYFLLKNGADTKEMLMDAFYRNIIPLLQEYFFGDYAKIGAVLGKGFVRVKNGINDKKTDVFAEFDGFEPDDFSEKMVFEIIDFRDTTVSHAIVKNGKTIAMDFQKAIQELMDSLAVEDNEA